jgi:hypothetical protein
MLALLCSKAQTVGHIFRYMSYGLGFKRRKLMKYINVLTFWLCAYLLGYSFPLLFKGDILSMFLFPLAISGMVCAIVLFITHDNVSEQ